MNIYHINKQIKRKYNFLKKEIGNFVTVFEENSRKESTDLGVEKESRKDEIKDLINTQSKDAN